MQNGQREEAIQISHLLHIGSWRGNLRVITGCNTSEGIVPSGKCREHPKDTTGVSEVVVRCICLPTADMWISSS